MKIRHIDTRPTEVGQAHEALGLPPVEQVIDRAQAHPLATVASWFMGFTLFGLGLFDFLDTLTTKIMMPLAGLLIALFAGWTMKRAHVYDEIGMGSRVFVLWYNVVRYLSPVAIVIIFLNVVGVIG